nr:hypothetical protein [Tanacetum cinerariifolium]
KPKSPLKLVDEPSAKDVPIEEPAYNEEEANIQRDLELSLKEQAERTQGPARLVVIRELDSGRIQPLPDVQGKGKEKRRTPMPTEASGHAESPSLDAKLALINSETESDNVVSKIDTRDQDESQAGPNLGNHDEGQAEPNLGVQDEGQDGSNPEPASSTKTLSSLQNLKKELSLVDRFFMEKKQEEEPEKTNVEAEVQSMVSILIHQDTSSVPPMTTPVIDLTTSQSGSPLPTSTSTTSIIKTTTSLTPPPQQSIADLILVKRIENLNIPYQVSKAVDEIVTDAVDWVMQAPLRARFSDLPTVDMKKILQQRMLKDKSYEAHEDHKNLYDVLQKSLERDYSSQLLSNLEEAHQKKRKRYDLPRTPFGSPPSQPPPLPPPAGASGAPDDSIPDEQVYLSDDEDFENDHLPKADSRKDWWKPLPEEETPANPKPAWTIPSSNVSDVKNNWATALVSAYENPAENSLLTKTGDMTHFRNSYCQQMNKTELTQADLEGQAYEVVKAFYPDV